MYAAAVYVYVLLWMLKLRCYGLVLCAEAQLRMQKFCSFLKFQSTIMAFGLICGSIWYLMFAAVWNS